MEMLFIIVLGLFFFVLFLVAFRVVQLVYISSQGAFYAASNNDRLKDLLDLSDIKKGDRAIDLGCGDGRVVIALAKAGAQVDGVEIDPYYYVKAKQNVKKAGVEDRVQLLNKNFWNIDLSEYDVIVVYGISYIMKKLEKKIQTELKSGARVLSVHYRLPTWKEDERRGEVWLYRK